MHSSTRWERQKSHSPLTLPAIDASWHHRPSQKLPSFSTFIASLMIASDRSGGLMGDSVYRETTCQNQSNRYSSPASLPRPGILSRQVQSPRLDRDPPARSSASIPSNEPSDFRCSEGTTTLREGSQLTHAGAQPTQIDVAELKIHMHYWEAKMSHPTC